MASRCDTAGSTDGSMCFTRWAGTGTTTAASAVAAKIGFGSTGNRSVENMPARHKPGLLQRLAAGGVLRIAARCRNAAALVADPLQFLDQIGAKTPFPEGFGDLHVDVSVRPV